MSIGENAAGERNSGKKAYSVKVELKAQSSTSCSFCWFVLGLYPTLKGMTDRDAETFRTHLQKTHGLTEDIER